MYPQTDTEGGAQDLRIWDCLMNPYFFSTFHPNMLRAWGSYAASLHG